MVKVKWSKSRLDKLQRLACLCMTGVKNTVATLALETLLDLPPLDLFIKSVAFNAYFNVEVSGRWVSFEGKSHSAIGELIRQDELLMHSDQMKALIVPESNFKSLLIDRKGGVVRRHQRRHHLLHRLLKDGWLLGCG